jgi:hypothetical protein
VAGASSCWRGVHICPLIPLIVSPCSGSVTRETCEIAMWFSNIYEKSNHGLTDTWTTLVESMETFSTGSAKLEAMDSYKIALPSSLNSAVLDTVTTFCTHDSRPVAFAGLPKDNCCELLSSMIGHIFRTFRACQSPKSFLVRTTTASCGTRAETDGQKWLLLGQAT